MFVFFNVSELGALRSVVPARQLPAAAAAEQVRWSIVTLVAPPLGGFLFSIARVLPFVADVVSYVFSLVSVVAMRTPFQEDRPAEQVAFRAELSEGVRWLWSHRFFRACALLFSWTNLIFEALFFVLIVVGHDQGLSGAEIGGPDRGVRRLLSARSDGCPPYHAPAVDANARRSAASGYSSALPCSS
jgi:Bacterial protein of unknown function (DUF894).